MTSPPLMFDTGPLAQLVHPTFDREISKWFSAAVAAKQRLVIPEIADYELRRTGRRKGIWRAASGVKSSNALNAITCAARSTSGFQ